MISEKMQKAINDQIQAELYSAYLYLSMQAWFESNNLSGFANWMNIQAQEETAHAMKFYNFLCERSGTVELQAIQQPPNKWDSPLAVFQNTLQHEQAVTARINDLVDAAQSQKDHATESFLKWFVDEQVEEEASADAILQQLILAKDAPGALFMIDRELGQRSFTPPTTQGE